MSDDWNRAHPARVRESNRRSQHRRRGIHAAMCPTCRGHVALRLDGSLWWHLGIDGKPCAGVGRLP